MVYEQAISPAGWSLPSHASLFTGLYQGSHGAHDQHKYLDAAHLTLAERLGAAGYATQAFCKNPYVGPATGLDRGFAAFNRPWGEGPSRVPAGVRRFARRAARGFRRARGERDSGARDINTGFARALKRFAAEERPFFAFVHYEDVHAPYRLPRRFARFLPPGVGLADALRVNQDPWRYLIDPASMGEREFETLRGLYDSAMHYVDFRVGEVLGWLRDLRLDDETMLIITADHGENLGDHGLMAHKYCLYETLLHVPLIVRYPAGIATPGRVAAQVQTLDVAPTVLGLAGLAADGPTGTASAPASGTGPPAGLDLLGSTRREFTFAEQSRPDLRTFDRRFPGADVSRFDRALRAIRSERWKFIWASDLRHELYDLAADPDERTNLIDAEPGIARELEERLDGWAASLAPAGAAAGPGGEAPEFGEEVKSRLRDLGYLE